MECIREVSLLTTDQSNEWISINDNTRSQLDKVFETYVEYVKATTKEPQRQIEGMTVLARIVPTGLNGFLTQEFLQKLSPIYHSRLFGMNRKEIYSGLSQVLDKIAKTPDKKMTRLPNGIRAMFPDVSTQGAIYASSHPLAEDIQLLEYRQDNRKPPPPESQLSEAMGDNVPTPTTPQKNRVQFSSEGKSNHTPIVIDEGGSPPSPQDSTGTAMTDDDRKPEASTGYLTQDTGTDEVEATDEEDTPGQAMVNRKRRRV